MEISEVALSITSIPAIIWMTGRQQEFSGFTALQVAL